MPPEKRRPLIGVTGITTTTPPWTDNSQPQLIDAIIRDYCHVVELAGGVPAAVPLLSLDESIPELVDRLDGLIIAGGMDVHPRLYDEEPLVGIGEMDYHLDRMHIMAVRRASQAGKPVLGICRGHQLICTAFGGKLYQDLPRQWGKCLDHAQKAHPGVATHKVTIIPGTRLHAIEGEEELWVNSHHHQAVKEVPEGFVATAHARDGVIEAMERPGPGFVLSVQWHPESIALAGDDKAMRLFQALVQAAAGG